MRLSDLVPNVSIVISALCILRSKMIRPFLDLVQAGAKSIRLFFIGFKLKVLLYDGATTHVMSGLRFVKSDVAMSFYRELIVLGAHWLHVLGRLDHLLFGGCLTYCI
jgi:hypothetical protein